MSDHYQTKPIRIRAVQLTMELPFALDAPVWFLEGLAPRSDGFPGPLRERMSANGKQLVAIEVKTPVGVSICYPGDWILSTGPNLFGVMLDSDFPNRYEPVANQNA